MWLRVSSPRSVPLVAHRPEDETKPAKVAAPLPDKALIIFSVCVSVPWLGFQLLVHDPALRPGMLDTALMGVIGAWLMRFGIGAGGEKK